MYIKLKGPPAIVFNKHQNKKFIKKVVDIIMLIIKIFEVTELSLNHICQYMSVSVSNLREILLTLGVGLQCEMFVFFVASTSLGHCVRKG